MPPRQLRLPYRKWPGQDSGQGQGTITGRRQFRDQVLPGEVERRFSALVEALRTEVRTRHYSYRTETTYLDWVRRYIAFHDYADPEGVDATAAVRTYLEYLAVEREVAASTQNQALNALVFFYKNVLRAPIGEMDEFARAKRPQRLSEVITREETKALLAQMEGLTGLMAGVMYGGGLRLMECVRLRVKVIDFARRQIMVRDGKGQKDRITMLPERFAGFLQEHLGRVKAIYEQDLAKGTAEVYIWPALARKYPRAGKEWIWQCFEQAWPHGEEPSGFLIVLSNSPRQHIQPGSKKHPCHTTQTGVKKQELKVPPANSPHPTSATASRRMTTSQKAQLRPRASSRCHEKERGRCVGFEKTEHYELIMPRMSPHRSPVPCTMSFAVGLSAARFFLGRVV